MQPGHYFLSLVRHTSFLVFKGNQSVLLKYHYLKQEHKQPVNNFDLRLLRHRARRVPKPICWAARLRQDLRRHYSRGLPRE